MKRSEINRIIRDGERFIGSHGFALPRWAYWRPGDWKGSYERTRAVVENNLGWDITDFGRGDYASFGLLLFTIRNGYPARDMKPYAEKILLISENQGNPMHFHWRKMEDIINRGGGTLVIELYGSLPDESYSDEPVTVMIDGIAHTIAPGGTVDLAPGESICIEQGVYHRFFTRGGRVLAGEVSMVNDDHSDNRFVEQIGRFPTVEEDEEPYRLLVSDYPRFL